MPPELIATIGVGVAMVGVLQPQLWSMRRDIGDPRERMACLEGLFEVFTGRQPKDG